MTATGTHVSSFEFARLAKDLTNVAHHAGLTVPGFRSPPRGNLQRSVRRRPDGSVVVAVRLQGRTRDEVVDDMVDGIVTVNALSGPAAERARRLLHDAA